MNRFFSGRLFRNFVLFFFFASYILYLGILNGYHLSYLEQNQLFRYNWYYVAGFLARPGGFLELAGAFTTQFLLWAPVSACIVALPGIFIFFLSRYIFKQLDIRGLLFSLFPVVLIAGIQSNYNYHIADTLGWLFALMFAAIYARIRTKSVRYLVGTVGWIALYFAIGFYSFVAWPFCVIIEFMQQKGRPRVAYMLALFIIPFLVPWASRNYIYYLPLREMWLFPAGNILNTKVSAILIILLLYYPLLILVFISISGNLKKKLLSFTGEVSYGIFGIVFLLLTCFFVYRYSYEYKNELFLEIDSHYQKKQWKELLDLAQRYPGNNQLVMYYTNLALYNSGQMADQFFSYKQSGTSGLWLLWKRNETTSFFGGEVFYELGYNNEALRWAFEAMVVKGPNPRSLKRLVLTNIINHNYAIAGKYLTLLEQTLFYKTWAQYYRACLNNPDILTDNAEIMEKRHLLIRNDFVADISDQDLGFMNLLENHPDNRMAYEYWMLTLLLRKDLDTFAANVYRMKELGYTRIPRHFEEAILLYSRINNQNILPQGYQISSETMERFHSYAGIFARNRQSINMAARALNKDFGHTFWFYMQFSNQDKESRQIDP